MRTAARAALSRIRAARVQTVGCRACGRRAAPAGTAGPALTASQRAPRGRQACRPPRTRLHLPAGQPLPEDVAVGGVVVHHEDPQAPEQGRRPGGGLLPRGCGCRPNRAVEGEGAAFCPARSWEGDRAAHQGDQPARRWSGPGRCRRTCGWSRWSTCSKGPGRSPPASPAGCRARCPTPRSARRPRPRARGSAASTRTTHLAGAGET